MNSVWFHPYTFAHEEEEVEDGRWENSVGIKA